jgi:hypothetical protein
MTIFNIFKNCIRCVYTMNIYIMALAMLIIVMDICCLMRAVYTTIFVKKQNGHYCINICYILVLTLHVSALILGHHQAYNDTSHSS